MRLSRLLCLAVLLCSAPFAQSDERGDDSGDDMEEESFEPELEDDDDEDDDEDIKEMIADMDSSASGSGAMLRYLEEQLKKSAGLSDLDISTQSKGDVIVPSFLQHVYNCWSALDGIPHVNNMTNASHVKEVCKDAIEDESEGLPADGVLPLPMQESDTVLTFMNDANLPQPTPVVASTGQPLTSALRIQFNYTLHKKGQVIVTEFRVHHDRSAPLEVPAVCEESIREDSLLIKLWMGELGSRSSQENQSVELIAERRISYKKFRDLEWVVLRNLSLFTEICTNRTFSAAISLYLTLGGACSDSTPCSVGFDNVLAAKEYQPYLTIFFKSEGTTLGNTVISTPINHGSGRERRESADDIARRTLADLGTTASTSSPQPTSSREELNSREKSPCKSYDYTIMLNEAGWQDLIVSPTVIKTKYCAGHCLSPMDPNRDPPHAILQTLANHLRPDLVPMTCCAPLSLQRLTVLLTFGASELRLIILNNLIVSSCACM
uniref:Transforming growth factor beta G HduTGFbG n=1 Tax=Halisarca dujardinii TaxID=2583056 RepID=A0A8F8ASH8_HALDU|nr:transforming growth factor beta G HduTGFbG [Halisarca dujardinii]